MRTIFLGHILELSEKTRLVVKIERLGKHQHIPDLTGSSAKTGGISMQAASLFLQLLTKLLLVNLVPELKFQNTAAYGFLPGVAGCRLKSEIHIHQSMVRLSKEYRWQRPHPEHQLQSLP